MSINRVILTGRLGKPPELRYTQSGKAVTTFSLAVSDNFNREKTHWINVTVWGKSAENCAQYLDKGSSVAVDGRLNTRDYENQSGQKVYVTEVTADSVQFLDSKGKSESKATGYEDLGHEIDFGDDEPVF